eukprot:CAMPEP_0198682650 /NCGR_PEP_ID=MMETSP1468-20131203/9139_1 /TAXON_ID=1461545 /ORGANISM="Mantoniella sp, Strain CCMP1436" /LENGTH=33 /DNA_ID= /DNA_START= /DNA_END= /DNA_ORIENTATION=
MVLLPTWCSTAHLVPSSASLGGLAAEAAAGLPP